MVKLTKSQRHARMKKIVAAFQAYVATYDSQAYYFDYEDRTFIKDMIYGVGIAIDPERFRGPGGWTQFEHEIRRHLELPEPKPDLAHIVETATEKAMAPRIDHTCLCSHPESKHSHTGSCRKCECTHFEAP